MRLWPALALIGLAAPAVAGEQCVWPFRDAPAEIATRMRTDMLTPAIKAACPGQNSLGVTFRLKPSGTPKAVRVTATSCPAIKADLTRWLKTRPAGDFMPYTKPQDVAFTIVLAGDRL